MESIDHKDFVHFLIQWLAGERVTRRSKTAQLQKMCLLDIRCYDGFCVFNTSL